MSSPASRPKLIPRLTLICMFLIMAGGGFAACWQLYQQRMKDEQELGLQMTRQRGQAMVVWLNDQVVTGLMLASADEVRNVCSEPEDPVARKRAEVFLRRAHANQPGYLLLAVMPFFSFSEMTITDANGQGRTFATGQSLVDSVDGQTQGLGGLGYNYVKAIRDGLPAYISEAKFSLTAIPLPMFVIALPITGRNGDVIGCFALGVKLDYFSSFFSESLLVGKTGRVNVLDDRGLYISHEQRQRILSTEAAAPPPLLERIVGGQESFKLTSVDNTRLYFAKEVFTGHATASRWWVVFHRNLDELHDELTLPLLSLLSLILLMFALSVWLLQVLKKGTQHLLRNESLQNELELHKHYQAEISHDRKILRSIIDNIHGFIFLRDAEGRYLTVNKHFSALVGLSQEEVIGKRHIEVLPDDTAGFSVDSDEVTRKTQGVATFEHTMRMHDGNLCDFLFVKEALYTSEGVFSGILGVAVDITELKKTQRELSRAMVRAEKASMAKSAFLSMISHEIRTPMNAIVGFIHLFERANLTGQQKDYLEKIRLASATLLSVINSVLDISKIESGKIELENAPYSLRALVDSVKSVTGFAAREARLFIEVQVDERVPDALTGDATRVNQILLNLVNNAIKFTSKGGVRVDVICDPADPAQPGCERDMLRFSVTDTGIGMTEEQLERVFQPFIQADVSTTRKYGGTGLGLTICKELACLMGGSISVTSQVGQGTCFTVRLPLISASSAAEPGVAIEAAGHHGHEAQHSLEGYRVLVVEDNIINQEIAMALLERFGITVEVADDGYKAIAITKEKRYDLLFMDMQMPGMDGLEATSNLRSIGRESEGPLCWLADVPIVAMTANAMREDRQRCLDAGMNDHLGKPLDPDGLYTMLLHWLPAKPFCKNEDKSDSA